MSEQQIDPEHPWAEASMHGSPSPVPVNINLEPVEIQQDSKTMTAIMMTLIDPTGVKTVFLSPSVLHQLVLNGANILDALQKRQSSGLVVADQNIEREVKQQFDQSKKTKEQVIWNRLRHQILPKKYTHILGLW